jgi:hypothetical protein
VEITIVIFLGEDGRDGKVQGISFYPSALEIIMVNNGEGGEGHLKYIKSSSTGHSKGVFLNKGKNM